MVSLGMSWRAYGMPPPHPAPAPPLVSREGRGKSEKNGGTYKSDPLFFVRAERRVHQTRHHECWTVACSLWKRRNATMCDAAHRQRRAARARLEITHGWFRAVRGCKRGRAHMRRSPRRAPVEGNFRRVSTSHIPPGSQPAALFVDQRTDNTSFYLFHPSLFLPSLPPF